MSPAWAEAEAEHLRIHALLSELCLGLSAQLGLHSNIMRMARCIAHRFHDRAQIGLIDFRDGPLSDGPVHVVAAASTYMATHLFGDARSLDLISSFERVAVQAVRKAYSSLYGYRHALISADLLARAGREWDEIEKVLPSAMA